jgi:hypothetical protein
MSILDDLAHGSVDLTPLLEGQPPPPEPEPRPEIFTHWGAAHEARHLAAAKLLGWSTPVLDAWPDPKGGSFGRVRFVSTQKDQTDDDLRKELVVMIVGGIGDNDLPDWPPRDWPLIKDAKTGDEQWIAELLEWRVHQPDERDQLWAGCRLEALAMVEGPKFRALAERYTSLLLAGHTLSIKDIDDVHDEVERLHELPPPEPEQWSFSDQLEQLGRTIHAIHGDRDPVPWREVLEVERAAGIVSDEEAQRQLDTYTESYNLMRRMLTAPDPDDQRKRALAIAAEYTEPKRKPRHTRPRR